MKRLFTLLIVAGLIGTFPSCGPEADTEEVMTDEQEAAIENQEDASQSTTDFFYSLPSPLIMAKVFKRTGLKYNEGITNSPENVSKYTDTHSKTLNLGIYSADLAYTILNKQFQKATIYMESVKRLSDDLGMSSVFDTENYLERFKNNMDHEDSLIMIVTELKGEMDFFMKDNKKEKLTILIFVGAWLENLYIATQLTKDASQDKVAMRIAEQKHVLNSLMNVATNFRSDEDFNSLYKKLVELKNLFDGLTVNSENEQVTMDELQLKAITEMTRDLRMEITG